MWFDLWEVRWCDICEFVLPPNVLFGKVFVIEWIFQPQQWRRRCSRIAREGWDRLTAISLDPEGWSIRSKLRTRPWKSLLIKRISSASNLILKLLRELKSLRCFRRWIRGELVTREVRSLRAQTLLGIVPPIVLLYKLNSGEKFSSTILRGCPTIMTWGRVRSIGEMSYSSLLVAKNILVGTEGFSSSSGLRDYFA